ncbi:hypothetical protein PMAYCL1PPCAC_16429, partial [Pristionchus mayeri]
LALLTAQQEQQSHQEIHLPRTISITMNDNTTTVYYIVTTELHRENFVFKTTVFDKNITSTMMPSSAQQTPWQAHRSLLLRILSRSRWDNRSARRRVSCHLHASRPILRSSSLLGRGLLGEVDLHSALLSSAAGALLLGTRLRLPVLVQSDRDFCHVVDLFRGHEHNVEFRARHSHLQLGIRLARSSDVSREISTLSRIDHDVLFVLIEDEHLVVHRSRDDLSIRTLLLEAHVPEQLYNQFSGSDCLLSNQTHGGREDNYRPGNRRLTEGLPKCVKLRIDRRREDVEDKLRVGRVFILLDLSECIAVRCPSLSRSRRRRNRFLPLPLFPRFSLISLLLLLHLLHSILV